MEVEDTDLARVDHRPDCRYAGPVIGFLVLAVLDKLPSQDVRLKLCPGDEVVVLPVTLCLPPSSRRICGVCAGALVWGAGGKVSSIEDLSI